MQRVALQYDQQFNCGMLKFFHRQDCMRKVETKAVMTVRMKFAILLIVSRFIIDIITFLDIVTY